MPFPNFNYCIICEGIRPEIGGKLTLLGYYGITPFVQVLVVNPNIALGLCFVVGFPPVEDTGTVYQGTFSVSNPSGSTIFQTPLAKIKVSSAGSGILGVNCVIASPYESGTYHLRIHINNEVKLDSVFQIRTATQAEMGFSGLPTPEPGGKPN